MTTIVDGLTDASTGLKTATASFQALIGAITAQTNASQQAATTVVNNFLARPLNQAYFCDPVNGNDSNTGQSYATAMKTLDGIFASMSQNEGAVIYLYGDATITNYHFLVSNVILYGVQPANTPTGRVACQRNITFLPTAQNSPDVAGTTYAACLIFQGSVSLFTDSINFHLPISANPPNARNSYILATGAMNVDCDGFTLTVDGPTAAALFGVIYGRMTANLAPVFSQGAAGHLFDGIAAGNNPNAVWAYCTNVTSA